MNVSPAPEQLAPEQLAPEPAAHDTRAAPPGPDQPTTRRRRSFPGRVADILLGKLVTLLLAAIALVLGIVSFVLLANGATTRVKPGLVFGLTLANLIVLLLLFAVLAGRITRVWVDRRRGSAGSRMHVRLVLLFSVVAVTPTIVVAILATAFFHYGIEAWFSTRVSTSLQEAQEASRGYLREHIQNIRADALAMANDLARAGQLYSFDPDAFPQVLATQTSLRGLTQSLLFDPDPAAGTDPIVASAGMMSGLGTPLPPSSATEIAKSGDVAVFTSQDGSTVSAVVELNSTPPLMLLIARPVDPQILEHANRTEQAVAQYEALNQNRSGLQVTFALIFALVALLVLFAAVLIGLVIANQMARPIGRLILAADRVRGGDLGVRVPEVQSEDEIAGLSRAFNRMTGQLGAQRAELMEAYAQLDERRRFTETVLAGVSAGVIGLDAEGSIELPNRAAGELLGHDMIGAVGHRLAEEVPEFASLLRQAQSNAGIATGEVQIGPSANRRTLLVRIGPELKNGRVEGYVVTFDDITELESAQRKAAWADVARRIAHEIKNPLTPIQLSAERLKRRFTREITSDPETFSQCADTIVRHVGDIGRMVDEFSAFARMPQPVIRPEDIGRMARETLVLQKNAHPEITWETDIPERGPVAPADRRLIGQALTNLLQNAADAVAMRPDSGRHIRLAVREEGNDVLVSVEDDGVGLPQEDRARLTEPYVTHKPKGTGLGLAIVKKIMEDHGGRLALADRTDGPGAVATLSLPMKVVESVGA
jgi:two-component system, NtrC family, nitrogen regulation sensor histidine kinase NtrY